ncbi:MAG: peptide chain release factor N(5)-glutamine methyltransferase [Candidatus Sungbacteria bacterium]|nr:peptide chain release factor N(5)-glutamine methyltransferase [Candidatus Sungbacteria bacterium]
MTIGEARAAAARTLKRASDAPALDADRLLLYVFGQPETAWLAVHYENHLSATQEQELHKLVRERASGKPLAYTLGEAWFYGRRFMVSPDVLIPRPATEDLIATSLEVIDSLYGAKGRPLVIGDIGTGSGCIAITLLLERPAAIEKIIAVDISPVAVVVAKKNADLYGLKSKIDFRLGDMLSPLKAEKVDLLVCNPPYVPTAELESQPVVETRGLSFEPRLALDGGPDGLVFVSQIKKSGIPAVIETVGGVIEVVD